MVNWWSPPDGSFTVIKSLPPPTPVRPGGSQAVMADSVPRMRVFAGPNGSGKSTLKELIVSELLGIYVNPNEIEKHIRDFGMLVFSEYGVETNEVEVLAFFTESSFPSRNGLSDGAAKLRLPPTREALQAQATST